MNKTKIAQSGSGDFNKMNKKNNGFISIEAVIVSSIVLSIGFASMLTFTNVGAQATERFKSLNPFGSTETPGPEVIPEFDTNGYPSNAYVNPAEIQPVSDFEFEDLGLSYRITNYLNESDTEVVIPKFHTDGKPITEIGQIAFMNKGLTYVVIPNSVTAILDGAFAYNNFQTMSGRPPVWIPNSVTNIEAGVFMGNNYEFLPFIQLPNGITEITPQLFFQSKLQMIDIPSDVVEIGEDALAQNNLTSVTIPDSVEIIGRTAFRDNFSLTTLTLSDNLRTIGVEAFTNDGFTSVIIPASVNEIGFYAFGNTQLTSVEFKGNAPTIIDPNMDYEGEEEIPGVIEHGVFGLCSGFGTHSIKVPAGQLSAYQALAVDLGVDTDSFYE
jgi:hypothetical protein